MGGTTSPTRDQSQSQTGNTTNVGAQQQQNTTAPWLAAQPFLSGILGQLQGSLGSTQLSPSELSGLQGLNNWAGYSSQFLPQVTGLTGNLLSGGNAMDQAGTINDAYKRYQMQLLGSGLIDPKNLNPMNTPGFGDALKTINSDISNQINQQFAGAGRDFSGMNAQTLARGLSQGEGALIQNQYNQNVANQLGAYGSLYNAGNTTGGLLSGLNQQRIANALQGINTNQAGQDIANQGYQQWLNTGAYSRMAPLQALQMLAGLGVNLGGLGSISNSLGSLSGTTQNVGYGSLQGSANPGLLDWLNTASKLFGGGR
jgi:hypothetical protein